MGLQDWIGILAGCHETSDVMRLEMREIKKMERQ